MDIEKTITFEDVEERIKNKKMEELTKEDVFDRYIAYGDDKELSNPEIQKLLIKYGYIDELTSFVRSVITDKEVIDMILSSNFVNEKDIILKNGKIQNIYFVEDSELPEQYNWMYIEFVDKDNITIKVKDIHFKEEPKEWKNELDNYTELNKYKDEELTIIIDNANNEMRLRCALKKDKKKLERIELHIHTNMSQMDGTNSCRDYIEKAKQLGMTSLAITDHRSSTSISRSSKVFRKDKR